LLSTTVDESGMTRPVSVSDPPSPGGAKSSVCEAPPQAAGAAENSVRTANRVIEEASVVEGERRRLILEV
jgi:hypothetical protein